MTPSSQRLEPPQNPGRVIRLARVPVKVFPHRDVASLEELPRASTAKTKVVVTDGVFSMDGDLAPVDQMLKLCEQYGAWLIVDDAHGFGTIGATGRGILEHFGLRSAQLIYMGTLGKAAGVAGAFVAAHETFIEWMVQRSRPYIYTTAGAPALAHALLTSIDLLMGPDGAARRIHLKGLIQRISALEIKTPWKLLQSTTAIQPLVIGTNSDVLSASAALFELGLWVTAIRAPTVPAETARLRITLSAAHTVDEVSQLIDALQSIRSKG